MSETKQTEIERMPDPGHYEVKMSTRRGFMGLVGAACAAVGLAQPLRSLEPATVVPEMGATVPEPVTHEGAELTPRTEEEVAREPGSTTGGEIVKPPKVERGDEWLVGCMGPDGVPVTEFGWQPVKIDIPGPTVTFNVTSSAHVWGCYAIDPKTGEIVYQVPFTGHTREVQEGDLLEVTLGVYGLGEDDPIPLEDMGGELTDPSRS